MIVWLIVQLMFWSACLVLLVAGFLAVVLAPPFFAGRYVWRRMHA